MANKTLFKNTPGETMPPTDTVNAENAPAYKMSPEATLAQFAATGCFNGVFYTSAEDLLEKVLEACKGVSTEFVAKTAIWSRRESLMKDMPAFLVAWLTKQNGALAERVFFQVIDNPKMLRNFVQILRSGTVGRKSLGSRPKRMVRNWLASRKPETIFKGSVGNDPSLSDIVRMVHPKPDTDERNAVYGYIGDRKHDATKLPQLVQAFEAWKKDPKGTPPDVPFEMLTSLPLSTEVWTEIARNARWMQTRMNLNTFLRHGVFKDEKMVELIAARLRNPDEVRKAKVFPYQLFTAFQYARDGMPKEITLALQDAMEVAIENVPEIPGHVWVFVDVSSSMTSPVTGHRKGATSKIRCVDAAAVFASAIVRKNPKANIVPFSTEVVPFAWNSRDSVMTNAQKLIALPSGGTSISSPMIHVNKLGAKVDAVIYLSDNQSWVDAPYRAAWSTYQPDNLEATATIKAWAVLKTKFPQARMVCVDMAPYPDTQVKDRPDVVNVGGFSDAVFDVVAQFITKGKEAQSWVDVIQAVQL